MFSLVFKFNALHLSLFLRICRSLGTYKDSFDVFLKFRTAHYLLSLGLTPMGRIHQCRAIFVGCSRHHSHKKRGSSGRLEGIGYPAWVFISNNFASNTDKKLMCEGKKWANYGATSCNEDTYILGGSVLSPDSPLLYLSTFKHFLKNTLIL